MFKNRRRAVSGPPQKTTPSPNAALAASQAFLKSKSSNGDLSSAAAAAALRSHSTTPVPVASVQTKRMQRKGSTASGASGGAASPPGVRRQASSGSMSERTFRTPSPSVVQNKSRSRASSAMDIDIPPVPAFPQNLETHKRNRSAGSSPMKVLAPTPRTPGRRRIRLDEGPDADGTSTASHSPEAEVSRRSSVNFSRPISPRPTPPSSPPPARVGHSGWFTGPIVNDVKPQGNVRRTSSVPSMAPGGLYNSRHNPEDSSGLKAKSSREMRNSVEKTPGNVVSSHLQGPARSKTPPRKPTIDLPATPQSSSSASDLSAESDLSSPQSRQAMRFVRKPSTVEESPEAEYAEERRLEKAFDPEASRVKSGSTRIRPPTEFKRTRAVSQPVPSTGLRVDSMTLQPATKYSHERNTSISPARSAHFALNAVDVSSGFRHQPPPRSISPIKSALKHSPSSSVRTSSPKGHGKPSSDAGSDSGSLDLQRSRQLKKGTRVSFEDNRAIREDDASISSSNSLDHSFSRWGGRSAQGRDNVSEDVMKPRPTLPSFGSVRRGRRDGDEELAEKVTEYVPSSMSSSHTMVDPHDDRVIKSHEYASQTGKTHQSLPSDMRTAEGPDYASDDASTVESPDSEHFHAITKGYGNGKLEPTTRKLETLVETPMDVPQIAVQPATPGTEREEEAFEMPGSWSVDEQPESPQDDREPLSTSNLQKFRDQNTEDQQISEDDSSEGESIYSDAPEDLSQLEGGFASLDAIVQGPAPSSLNAAVASRARDEKPRQNEEPKRKADNRENRAKQQRKEGMEAANTPTSTDLSAESIPRGFSQRKKKAKVIPEPLVVAPQKTARRSSIPRAANVQPRKPALKSTMRVEKPQPPQRTPSGAKMRTTMRTSMRGPGPSGGLAASRYANVDLPEPRSALQKKKIPMGVSVSTGRPNSALPAASKDRINSMPPLTRSRSNDSDVSASSFRRSRPPSSMRGKYTMRSSMRDSLVELPSRQQTRPISPPLSSPKSLSVRSLSPTGSFFGKKKVSTNHHPQYAQRASAASAPSTPKASRFSRIAKPNPAKAKAPAVSALKKSRFADSDDEEELGLPVFRSRIADPDDEDDVPPMPIDLRPVRGIPRRDDDGDSTELEDESDMGEPNSPPSLTKRSGGKSRSKPEAGASEKGENSLADPRSSGKCGLMDSKWATDGEAPPKKSKRGFFGLGKKRESSLPRPSTSDGAAFTSHDDTVLAVEPPIQPSNEQRRHTLLCNAEESWPLAAEEKEEEESEAARGRPMTAGASVRKPKLSKRWSSAMSPMGKPSNASQEQMRGASEVAVGRSGKKKKFSGLRKAFGLKD
ncbi:hypothetical protein IWX90DRAFT_391925 [Phyllosticta citrichinensis]|uniref:Uncharacterized protein n=1 Tax=Phyllosticta citrichinensis TaxID=1130410 RepID=A0ABR1XIF4_9PEZI